jgi:DNA-binding response OmpR family regulator
MRVLVVEDEQDIAGLIEHTLERSGDMQVAVCGGTASPIMSAIAAAACKRCVNCEESRLRD